MNTRQTIEELKASYRSILKQDVLQLKNGIIREIDYLWRIHKQKNPNASLDKFSDDILKYLNVPVRQKNEIVRELKENQNKIAELHQEYFNTLTPKQRVIELKPGDYEKFISLYSVDFPDITGSIRDITIKEVKKAVIGGYGFETLRQNLITAGLGTGEAYTQANTALSQFDNSSMFELAGQAGIDRFKYGGVLQEDSRIFCVNLITKNKTYTVAQIKLMDNKQGLLVITSCGGYNCTHYWYAYINKK